MPAESSYSIRSLTHLLGNDTDGNVGRVDHFQLSSTTTGMKLLTNMNVLSGAPAEFRSYGDISLGNFWVISKTRDEDPTAHTIVHSGDLLSLMSYRGSDGTAFRQAALFEVYVDGTPGASDMPGRIQLSTTPSGSATPLVRFLINNDGQSIFTPGSTTPATLSTNGSYTLTPTSNTNFRISYRGSDGSTRTGNITLS